MYISCVYFRVIAHLAIKEELHTGKELLGSFYDGK